MKKLMLCILLAMVMAGPAFAVEVPEPILWYEFEGDLTDSIGDGDGTSGGAGNSYAPGPFGDAYIFDGSGRLSVDGNGMTSVFGDMAGKTMVSWVRIDSNAGNMHFFGTTSGDRFYVSRVVWGGETGLTLASNTTQDSA